MRPILIVARMQKAAAVMQFKLEGQMIARNPTGGWTTAGCCTGST